jgi:hypothetical protein
MQQQQRQQQQGGGAVSGATVSMQQQQQQPSLQVMLSHFAKLHQHLSLPVSFQRDER